MLSTSYSAYRRYPLPWRGTSLTVASLLLLAMPCATGSAAENDQPTEEKSRVGKLIERLGAESYATRILAREELQRMGLEAFDELHLAQYHPDNEIAMAARFLVSSLAISWSKESDPPEVREALIEYGAQSEEERGTRIDLLAEFSDRQGLAALVRLTRFETSLRLSRRAALALMQQSMSDDPATRREHAQQIIEGLGDNTRQAAEWLRVYAKDLAGGRYSSDRWRELIADQRQEIDSVSTQQSTRPSVLELVRVCAVRAAAAGAEDEAIKLATDNIDLIPPNSRELIDAASWAIDNQLHRFVLELQRQHPRIFDQHPLLLYSAAEALNVAGKKQQAEKLAQQAAAIKPLPQDEAEKAKMQPREIEETAQAHREIGLKLEERGLFHWAEREFRQIIDAMELDANPSTTTRLQLARMLAELNRHQDVVDVLQPLVDRIEKDSKLRRQLNSQFMFEYNRIRSEVDYHTAMILLGEGKTAEAKPLLTKAYRLYPRNIDILIEMYRLESDPEWEQMVRVMLSSVIRRLDSDVQDARTQARRMGPMADPLLAQQLNQYAWLVCNTEGDYQKALRYSLQSLELEEDYAKLDTCARCYFAVGDLENAIVMQKRALRLMPHSPPLRRQLVEFEQALEEADETK